MTKSTIDHVVGEGGICWCGVTHALSTDFRLYYICQYLANGKRCANEIKQGEIFCHEHSVVSMTDLSALWREGGGLWKLEIL